MILKGLPEFFAYNREMSRLNRPLVTWREFQRLKKNGLGATPPAHRAAQDGVPLLEAPKYTKGHETPPAGLPEAVGRDVHTEDFLEPEPLSLSPVTNPEETS